MSENIINTKKANRYEQLDLVRAAACLMVVLIHSSADFFYAKDAGWLAANVYDAMVRCAVPLFFMLSGALLMKKAAEEPAPSFVKRRYARILPPFLVWGILGVSLNSPDGVLDFLTKLFCANSYFHLWYLYLMVGLNLLLPVAAKWYAAASDKEKRFYLLAWLAVCCISLANAIVKAFTGYKIDVVALYHLREFIGGIWYFVLGAFIFDQRGSAFMKRVRASAWLLCFFACGLVTALATYLLSAAVNVHSEVFYPYRAPLVALSAGFFFAFALRTDCAKWRVFPAIRLISACSLGIYCIHAFLLDYLPLDWTVTVTGGRVWLTIPLKMATVFIVSTAASFILRKIPYVRKIA